MTWAKPKSLSAKKYLAIVSSLAALYSFSRVAVLFLEALAVVRDGRAEDYELINVCERGDARGSAKMRAACLKARSDLASPVVFKAIVQAVATSFKDFTDTVGSPFKLGLVVLFVVSSIMFPIQSWARAIFGADRGGYGGYDGNQNHNPNQNQSHYISYAPPWPHQPTRRGIRGRVRKMLNLRRLPSLQDVDCEDRFHELEPGTNVDLKCDWSGIDIGDESERPTSPTRSNKKWD
jgi:hypothetical protein